MTYKGNEAKYLNNITSFKSEDIFMIGLISF